jgi:AcrR family transcriptional regulator
METATSSIDKRSRLVGAAADLAYRNGFASTSLADIARDAEVPLGNIYYYFKTKAEIGEAIADLRLEQLRALRMQWENASSPRERLSACIDDVAGNKDSVATYGCPVGTYCSEVSKTAGPVAARAMGIFAEHLAWIERQFRSLGKKKESYGLAVHLLSALQGAAVLAHTLHKPELVAAETERLKKWVRSL